MCGRYTITVTMDELIMRYMIDPENIPYHVPRYNVSPGQMIPVILNNEGIVKLDEFKWGLIPFWAKDEKVGYKMINARAETVTEKPAYRNSFKQRRCLIPADGFYEWKVTGKDKQPMRILLKDKRIFSMAGLYGTWTSPEGKKVSSCTIITTDPNELMVDIHDRMPVILRQEDEADWLDRENTDLKQLQFLLKPYAAGEMLSYPISQAVGNVRNQGAELVEELK